LKAAADGEGRDAETESPGNSRQLSRFHVAHDTATK
jgi:hypothetical protein